MNWKSVVWIFAGVLIWVLVVGLRFVVPAEVSNTTRSGTYVGSQVWSGQILVTGDTLILGKLIVLPGTIVRFAVQDDTRGGDETPPDGYNDRDPTRLLLYAQTHSELDVLGTLTAVGTREKNIVFTSASSTPALADWVGISPLGDESRIEYARIEWSRHGIGLGTKRTPHTIFKNNILTHTLWGPLSLGSSGAQAYDNEIFDCGHEGIDVQGGNPIIRGNYVHDCHAGIVVLSGSPRIENNSLVNVGDGIAIIGGNPFLEHNRITLAAPESRAEWRYQDFAYSMYG